MNNSMLCTLDELDTRANVYSPEGIREMQAPIAFSPADASSRASDPDG